MLLTTHAHTPVQLEHSGCLSSILLAHDMLADLHLLFVLCDNNVDPSRQCLNAKALLECVDFADRSAHPISIPIRLVIDPMAL